MNWTTKQGDTRRALKATLTPAQGSFGGDVQEVRFRMSDTFHRAKIDREVDLWHAPDAVVVFTSDEVGSTGIFLAEFVVTYTDGAVETFPSERYINIRINTIAG